MAEEDAGIRDEEVGLQGELERLRAENEALKSQLEGAPKKVKRGRWRDVIAWILIVLGCIFALSATVALWARATTLDTDTFVRTVAPLIQEDEVASAVSDETVRILFEEVKVDQKVEEALPDDIKFLGDPVSGALESGAKKIATEVLKSDQFQFVWEKILRQAHSLAVETIVGDGKVQLTEKGVVVLDVGELLTDVRDRLVDAGVSVLANISIPEDAGRIELFSAEELGVVKGTAKLLDTLNWLLPILCLACFAGAFFISNDRRRSLLGIGVGLAITMGIGLVILGIAKSQLLGQIENPDYFAAAGVIWVHLFEGLVQVNWGLLVLGVVLAAGAAVTGPYGWAVKVRGFVSREFSAARDRRKSGEEAAGPVGKFFAAHTWGLRVAGAALALVILIALPTIKVGSVIIVAVVYLVYLAVIELLR